MMLRPNTYDYLKVLALISMVIDHIWYFLYPEQILFRVFGRFAFPVFLFLVWYNHSFRFRWLLWFRWILLQVIIRWGRYLWYIEPTPLNILLAIGATRVVLYLIQKYWNFSREVLIFVCSLVLVWYTDEFVDYGTMNLVFALLWYRSRRYGAHRWLVGVVLLVVAAHMWYMYTYRGYTEPIFMIGVSIVLFASLAFLMHKNTNLSSVYEKRDALILFVSRHALVLYVAQAVILWWYVIR